MHTPSRLPEDAVLERLPGMSPAPLDPDTLRPALHHILVIGGGSGAGKTTVARRLAADYGLQIYHAEQFSRYAVRTTPADAPLLHAFMAMDMDQRWLDRSPQVMFDTFHGFQGELFGPIVEDLLALPRHPPILAEGFTLLPRLLAPLVSRPNQAVWLLPTPRFRRAAFDSRGSTWDIPSRTRDPERALANLLARDQLFTDEVRSQVHALGLPFVEVDRNLGVDDVVNRVAAILHLKTPPETHRHPRP